MCTEKLVERLGRQISRRELLKSLGASTVSTLLALTGLPKTASASHCPAGTHEYYCCCLCQLNSGSCSNCDRV